MIDHNFRHSYAVLTYWPPYYFGTPQKIRCILHKNVRIVHKKYTNIAKHKDIAKITKECIPNEYKLDWEINLELGDVG